jgi:hypothetical protein
LQNGKLLMKNRQGRRVERVEEQYFAPTLRPVRPF